MIGFSCGWFRAGAGAGAGDVAVAAAGAGVLDFCYFFIWSFCSNLPECCLWMSQEKQIFDAIFSFSTSYVVCAHLALPPSLSPSLCPLFIFKLTS